MGLYFVLHNNRFFNRGDWIDEDELGMVQKVEMLQVGNRYEPQRFVGAVVELSPIRHLCVRIQKRGIDNTPPKWHLFGENWELSKRVKGEFYNTTQVSGEGKENGNMLDMERGAETERLRPVSDGEENG